MAELEQQLTQMLQNPEILQQVISMAQSFGLNPPPTGNPPKEEPQPAATEAFQPAPDMLQRLSQFASLPMLDKNQKGLLNALSPYLSKEKVRKLENAMTIAHLATLASVIFPGNRPEVK